MSTTRFTFPESVPLHEDARGSVRVIGSRVTLITIVSRYEVGDTVEEIHEGFPSVTIPQINAIIAWYLDNRAPVDGYVKEAEAKAEKLRQEIESQPGYITLREKLERCREQRLKT